MTPIAVDWNALTRAAQTYGTARTSDGNAVNTLAGKLNENWGCAGTCDIAKQFTEKYDPAALAAVKAGANITNAYGKLHDLLGHTAVNHQNAESAAKTPPGTRVAAPTDASHFTTPAFRGAYGQGVDAPIGWSAVVHLLTGHDWPDGDPAKLRSLGSAWRTAASALRSTSASTCTAGTEVSEQTSPELDKATIQIELVSNCVEDAASAFDKLAGACEAFAKDVEDTQNKIRDALETIAALVVAGAIVGGVLGGLAGTVVEPIGGTAAGGAAGGAGGASVSGSLIAASTAARILPFLITLDAAVVVDTAIVGGVMGGAIGAIGLRLDDLLNSTATAYTATDNPRSGAHEPKRAIPNPEAFPGLTKVKGKSTVRGGGLRRRRWVDEDGNIYEEDTQHGTLEKYDKRGRHLGEFNPDTGTLTKGPDSTRRVEP